LEADIRSGRRPLLSETDRFRFSCTSCGKCCFGPRIILTPADVGLMATGRWARDHGVATTRDLHVRGGLRRFLNPETNEPVCMIAVEGPDAPCPFLVPEVAYPSRVPQLIVERHIASGRHPVEAVRLAGLKPMRLLCGLHEDGSKPMVCKSAPLGRVQDDGRVGYLVEAPHPECPGMREPAEWIVADWVRDSRLEAQFREVAWFSAFMEHHRPRFGTMADARLEWIGAALYDPDGAAMDLGWEKSAPSRTLPLAGLMTFARELAESFASGPEAGFEPVRLAGDVEARISRARDGA
jgi:hypothetical protein